MPSLGKDLAAIRNQKGLSIEDIRSATKVPPHVLRSIEDDSIFSQINQNNTYVRSYVRSYAKAIGIQEADIVRALDQVEAGTYEGSLGASRNLQEHASDTSNDPEKNEREKELPDETPVTEDTPADTSQEDASSNMMASVDWVDVGRKANPIQSKSRVWAGLLIIVLVVAVLAALFLFYHYYETDTAEEPVDQETTTAITPEDPSDSLRDALIAEDNQPARADTTPVTQGTLGDTLSIAIYAANGKLEPVRIYTDILGQQNPYWVSQGDTIRFNFVNTVRVRAVNQYNRMQLLFNGHVIQNYYQQYYNEESGMIELDRALFEDHPEWRSPAG